jgi:hypothetical protein
VGKRFHLYEELDVAGQRYALRCAVNVHLKERLLAKLYSPVQADISYSAVVFCLYFYTLANVPKDIKRLILKKIIQVMIPQLVVTICTGFSGGKGGRCVRLTTLPPSCAVFMISGNLNFLEPSGPLQVCNRTAYLICTGRFNIR